MRSKENAEDYRFISEPDLPLIQFEKKYLIEIEKNLPETPTKKIEKIIKKHKLSKYDAEVLTKNLDIVEFFEKVAEKVNIKLAVSWVTVELKRLLNYANKELDEVDIKPEHFIELLELVEKEIITELKAKEILNKFIPKSFSPKEIAEQNKKISSENEIEKIAKKAISENEKAVLDYKSGKKESINFLIGQVMKMSNKRADFKTAKEVIEKLISK